MFATYDYSVLVGVVYVEDVLFASLALTIMDYSLFPTWSILTFSSIATSLTSSGTRECLGMLNLMKESTSVRIPM